MIAAGTHYQPAAIFFALLYTMIIGYPMYRVPARLSAPPHSATGFLFLLQAGINVHRRAYRLDQGLSDRLRSRDNDQVGLVLS